MDNKETLVVHIRNREYCTNPVYIGRPSIFGNPFLIGRDGDRAEVIQKFKTYFNSRMDTDSEFRKEILLLKGKTLLCYCSPFPCHGHVIAEYLNNLDGIA